MHSHLAQQSHQHLEQQPQCPGQAEHTGASTSTALTPSVPLTKLLRGGGLRTALLLLALTTTGATPLCNSATSSTTASAASATSTASATPAAATTATASTAAADTSTTTTTTTPTTTPTPSTASTTASTAPATPTSAPAPLASASAAAPARGRRSTDRLETTKVGRSSRSNRGQEGGGGTPLKDRGLLQPLPVPEQPWQVVSLDFITGLPSTSRGHNSILVVIDKFSKMGHFILTNATATAEATTRLFFDRIITIHGIPATLISYRDPKFTSKFWKELMGLLGTKLAMSSAYHPKTDGQIERLNQVVEQLLRTACKDDVSHWDTQLPTLEFAYNNASHAATGKTPFFLCYGREPLTP
ncbi:unnamed protein product [Closterium sp. NIES-54]